MQSMLARFTRTTVLHITVIPQSFQAGQTHHLFGIGMGKEVDEKFWILQYIQNNNSSLTSKKLLGMGRKFLITVLFTKLRVYKLLFEKKHALYHW